MNAIMTPGPAYTPSAVIKGGYEWRPPPVGIFIRGFRSICRPVVEAECTGKCERPVTENVGECDCPTSVCRVPKEPPKPEEEPVCQDDCVGCHSCQWVREASVAGTWQGCRLRGLSQMRMGWRGRCGRMGKRDQCGRNVYCSISSTRSPQRAKLTYPSHQPRAMLLLHRPPAAHLLHIARIPRLQHISCPNHLQHTFCINRQQHCSHRQPTAYLLHQQYFFFINHQQQIFCINQQQHCLNCKQHIFGINCQ